MIFDDNVYNLDVAAGRSHTIAPGGFWTYALQVQNDGPTTADLTVAASTSSSEGLSAEAQFIYAYHVVTSFVLSSSGFTFDDVAPGEVRTFGLRFQVPAGVPEGSIANALGEFVPGPRASPTISP